MNASALRGVLTILPTPFRADGALDVESLGRLIDFQFDCGVHGLAVLGFMGEAHKLTSTERREVIEASVRRAGRRGPVWVGIRALGTAGAVEQAQEAEALGAKAVFAAPIPQATEGILFDYYRTIAAKVKVPVIIHDYPESFGIEITAELVARLAREGGVEAIKLEEPPVGTKVSKVLQLSGGKAKVFGGLGGTSFLEELERGAVGTMTGFSFPEILVRIYDLFTAGRRDEAAAVFDRYLPLLRYEFQPKIGLALRKRVYLRRGAIADDFIRPPGARLDAYTADELERTVRRVGLSLDAHGPHRL
jgi:4-hydroxy-tetrahydrodipicolinate synthase